MSAFRISEFQVDNLWNSDKSFTIPMNDDVTIIIGPNASGKTTVLNIIRYLLTGDVLRLSQIPFSSAQLRLKSFDGAANRTIRVTQSEDVMNWKISREEFAFDLSEIRFLATRDRRGARRFLGGIRDTRRQDLVEQLRALVPAAWLPVTRRLPMSDTDDPQPHSIRNVESVDSRLEELEEQLSGYRLRLESRMSERYKEFEKSVLGVILYDPRHDQLGQLGGLSVNIDVSDEEQSQLTSAFKQARLLDTQMQRKINQHFSHARDVVARLASQRAKGPPLRYDVNDVLILPLLHRTRAIVEYARQLESERKTIFASLRKFERIVSNFMTGKTVRVKDSGEVSVTRTGGESELPLQVLSSGEKQIMILLIQALLYADSPVVYVADEPELSLHVAWQAKLVTSLLELGNEIQIILATHSPDIVSDHMDKVVDLGHLRFKRKK